YTAPTAGYAYDGNYFTGTRSRGPLTGLASGASAGNGVYATTPGAFPTQSYGATNYYVDLVFALMPPPDTTAPVLIGRGPAAGATDAGLSGGVTATFSEPVVP